MKIISFFLGLITAMVLTLLVLLYQIQGNAMFFNWGVWLLLAMVALRLVRAILLIKVYVARPAAVLAVLALGLSLTSCGYTVRAKTKAGNIVQLNTAVLDIDIAAGDKIAAVRQGWQYVPIGAGYYRKDARVDTLVIIE